MTAQVDVPAQQDPRPNKPASPAGGSERWRSLVGRAGQWWTLGVLVILVAVFGILNPAFISQQAWLATAEYAVVFVILGTGQTFVILTAGIDLSVGAVLGASAMAGAVVMRAAAPSGDVFAVVAGILASLFAGAAIGLLNGLLITRLRLPPFIVTLATLTAFGSGVSYLLNNGNPIAALPEALGPIGGTVLLGWISIPVLIAAVVATVSALVLAKTRFGLRTYAMGSNETAVSRAGIRVRRHLVRVYVISGLLASIAGFILTARFATADPVAGTGDELYAIASAVIGGASLFGGRGTIAGTVVGALTISVLTTGLVLLGIQPFWQPVAIGLVLVTSVAVDQARSRISQS